MSDAYKGDIHRSMDTDWWRTVTIAIVGIAFLSMIFAAANVFSWITATDMFGSVHLYTLYGIALVLTGVGVVFVGVASATDVVETRASDKTGVLPGTLAAAFALAIIGLVVSQTLGISSTLGWAVPALLAGVLVFFGVTFASDDLGSTLPWGLFAAFVGVLFLTGVISPEWTWKLTTFDLGIKGIIAIPSLAFVASLLTAWSAAKATEGFGVRGQQTGAYFLVGTNAFFMLGLLAMLVLFVTEKGAERALKGFHIGPGFSIHWPFVMNGSGLGVMIPGVKPAIVGTFWLVLGAILVSVPLGVGAAVFLTEYAERGSFTSIVDIVTNGLWSTPSIVYGLFGYAFLLPRLGGRPSVLAGQLVLGFMLLPLVLITSREAIQSVPDAYRDGSVALGVTRWQTIRSVVLPAAVPGIITGIILGVGRIAGETAPLILVTAGGLNDRGIHVLDSFQFSTAPPFVTNDALLHSSSALPYQIYAVIEAGVSGSEEFGWATAFLLLVVIICFYVVGIATRLYFQRKLNQ
ncbi:phosphate ABC transporter permease PstA [Haladaptatus sp.]|uniref:phosphate ABC transporter permease PstA n=1 Tax=Haladaptatus sp. TaxID=1973141 RepID=UPI003C31465C